MADNSNFQSNQAANAVPVSPLKEILTIEEAAEFLSVSKSYLYKQTSAQAIPHYKPTANGVTSNAVNLRHGFSPEESRQSLKSRNGRMPIASRPGSDVRRDYLFQCGAVASNLRTSGNDAEDCP